MERREQKKNWKKLFMNEFKNNNNNKPNFNNGWMDRQIMRRGGLVGITHACM